MLSLLLTAATPTEDSLAVQSADGKVLPRRELLLEQGGEDHGRLSWWGSSYQVGSFVLF